jgi:gliding motility-associated-like protein
MAGAGNAGFGNFTVQSFLGNCPGPVTAISLGSKPVPDLQLSYDSLSCKGVKKPASAIVNLNASLLWSDLSPESQSQFGPGKHWVTASLNGCSVTDTFEVRNIGPIAAFTTNPADSLLEVYREIAFLDQSAAGRNPITSWTWNLGNAFRTSLQNPVNTYLMENAYDVSLIVADQVGCTDTITKTLNVGPVRGWFIPNLFTPNQDNVNDVFVVKGLEKYPGTSLLIVNRWGKTEAEFSDYQNNWDGSNLEEGVYFYTIRRSDGQEFSGFVELKR